MSARCSSPGKPGGRIIPFGAQPSPGGLPVQLVGHEDEQKEYLLLQSGVPSPVFPLPPFTESGATDHADLFSWSILLSAGAGTECLKDSCDEAPDMSFSGNMLCYRQRVHALKIVTIDYHYRHRQQQNHKAIVDDADRH
jgi:hypothetical protein